MLWCFLCHGSQSVIQISKLSFEVFLSEFGRVWVRNGRHCLSVWTAVKRLQMFQQQGREVPVSNPANFPYQLWTNKKLQVISNFHKRVKSEPAPAAQSLTLKTKSRLNRETAGRYYTYRSRHEEQSRSGEDPDTWYHNYSEFSLEPCVASCRNATTTTVAD